MKSDSTLNSLRVSPQPLSRCWKRAVLAAVLGMPMLAAAEQPSSPDGGDTQVTIGRWGNGREEPSSESSLRGRGAAAAVGPDRDEGSAAPAPNASDLSAVERDGLPGLGADPNASTGGDAAAPLPGGSPLTLAPAQSDGAARPFSDEHHDTLEARCSSSAPCRLHFEPPTSTEPEALPLAERLQALTAANLAEREGLCVADPGGRLSKRLGEALPDCPPAHTAFLVRSRFERSGRRFYSNTRLFEVAPDGSPLGDPWLQVRQPISEEVEFPFAADKLAEALGDVLGAPAPRFTDRLLRPPKDPTLHLNLKLGNTLAALEGFDVSAFSLRFDLEFDYYLRPYLPLFLEAGAIFGNAERKEDDEQTAFSLVPVRLGLKYVFFPRYAVRPYVGLGLGLGILSDLVETESREITLSFSGLLGIAWMPWSRVGFNLEANFNFDELRVSGGSSFMFGVSFNFGAILLF